MPEIVKEGVTYLRHGDRALKARVYRPGGNGPFPAVIDIHGGAWGGGDLADGELRNKALSRASILVAAIEFRDGADGYPSSLQDINYAVRWLKSGADERDVRPDRLGLTGNSSGAHLAMLAAMRPADPRYMGIPGPAGVDASVQCVGMLWPVINPLSRYRHARGLRESATPPEWVGRIPERQETYWKTEAAMAEGSPVLILECGEKVSLPPALYIQGRPNDGPHDYRDPESLFGGNEPERFVARYREAGGQIDFVVVAQARRAEESVGPSVAFFRAKLMG